MPAQQWPFIGVYRITDWRNLAHILQFGMYATNHVRNAQADYRFIGDSDLTGRRAAYPTKPPATGVLGDYVPFYFGRRSPMLYTLVRKGWAQERDVIYLLVKVEDLIETGCDFCFTDGQANTDMTNFYVDPYDMTQLDKAAIEAKLWRKTEDDPDRTRRKSAELLVRRHVAPDLISGIVVKDRERQREVKQIVVSSGFPTLPVAVRGTNYYYAL